jgi:tRNA(Arg) A34 adenosine deaminase TadA
VLTWVTDFKNFFVSFKAMNDSSYTVKLPQWVGKILPGPEIIYPTVEERMELAIILAANNINNNGGPFGAAIFEQYSGRLVAPGINLVQQSNCSVVHAEIVAIILAQQKVANFDLGAEGLPDYELVSTTEPCAMCLGAIPWSGINSLVCGARDEDARSIGFDEGDKPDDWSKKLQSRTISVTRDILRDKAKAVLQQYVDAGGIIYNGRSFVKK